MIEINVNLVAVYYDSIVEEQWSPQMIKNKLAYMKRRGMYKEHLALHCANAKYKVDKEVGK